MKVFDLVRQLNSIKEERESWAPDPDSELSLDILALEKAVKIIIFLKNQIQEETI